MKYKRMNMFLSTAKLPLTPAASRFFSRKIAKVDKSPPVVYDTVPLSLVAGQENQAQRDSSFDEPPITGTAFRFPQVSSDNAPSSVPSSYPSSTHSSFKHEADSQKVKPRPSFATLRTKSMFCSF